MDEESLNRVIEHFKLLNGSRLQQTYQVLLREQVEFLQQIPLFFHVNAKDLPGYISEDTPCGISFYSVDEFSAHYLASRQKESQLPTKSAQISAIYMIGSTGTAAYSQESDIDIWLCYHSGLSKTQLESMELKARKIEEQADLLDLEVHFFLMNHDDFRLGRTVALSTESSGSAQHDILLDEFYRTAILMAGCFPAWWVVPPELEENYDLCLEQYKKNNYAFVNQMIDFGSLEDIALDEYFGGSVWQLSKAIDAPYKSFMKLLLIESYVYEYPQTQLLSKKYKQAVYRGEMDSFKLDPYIMLLNKISNYLSATTDHVRKEILYRSFYFKVGLNLTMGRTDPNLYQHEMLLRLVDSWGWNLKRLAYLDTRKKWNILDVLEERQVLYEALAKSYRKLTTFARNTTKNKRISNNDVTIIGRKLFAVYERKAGKIDIIAQGLHGHLLESAITLFKNSERNDVVVWNLYAGHFEEDIVRNIAPLKQAHKLTDLIVWGYFNKIIEKTTRIIVISDDSTTQHKKIITTLKQIEKNFGNIFDEAPELDDYSQPSAIKRALFFVENNLDVNSSLEDVIGDKEVCSDSQRISTAINVEQIIITSWHEVYVNHFADSEGIVELIRQYLAWYVYRDHCEAIAPVFLQIDRTCEQCMVAAKQLTKLFSSVIAFFVGTESMVHSQYLLQVDNSYYAITYAGLSFRRKKFLNTANIYDYLSHQRREFINTKIDPYMNVVGSFKTIFQYNKKNVIQFFYETTVDQVKISILDERGSLFMHTGPFFDEKVLINQYAKFIDSVISRVNILVENNINPEIIESFEFIKLTRMSDGSYDVQIQDVDPVDDRSKVFNIQVIADSDDLDSLFFTIYLEGIEYSSLTYGNALYKKVAEEIVNRRPSRGTYPVFITDISVAPQLLGEGGLERIQSSNFYKYKIRVEERIDRAISQL